MKKVVKRIVNIIIDIIVILILAVSVLIVTLSLTSKSSGVPNIFGVAPLSVLSSSMEDTINIGDMILCEVTDDPSYEYEKGDIVTFPITVNGESVLNTHRIVEVIKDDNITYYRTQGDNKKTNPEPDKDLQTSPTIVAKYTGTRIGGVGNFLSFIRTRLGFFLCVLLPMIIFFVYEAIRVVLNLLAYNKEKKLSKRQSLRLIPPSLPKNRKRELLRNILPPSEKIGTRRKMSPKYKHLLMAIIPLIIPIKL